VGDSASKKDWVPLEALRRLRVEFRRVKDNRRVMTTLSRVTTRVIAFSSSSAVVSMRALGRRANALKPRPFLRNGCTCV
jgi:hypothetical protein